MFVLLRMYSHLNLFSIVIKIEKQFIFLFCNLRQNEDPSERSGQTWGLLPGTTVMAPVQNPHSFLQRQDSSEPSSMSNTPCLDILLSENILAHILAASRMPVSVLKIQ